VLIPPPTSSLCFPNILDDTLSCSVHSCRNTSSWGTPNNSLSKMIPLGGAPKIKRRPPRYVDTCGVWFYPKHLPGVTKVLLWKHRCSPPPHSTCAPVFHRATLVFTPREKICRQDSKRRIFWAPKICGDNTPKIGSQNCSPLLGVKPAHKIRSVVLPGKKCFTTRLLEGPIPRKNIKGGGPYLRETRLKPLGPLETAIPTPNLV